MLSVRLPSGSRRPTGPIARRLDKARMAVIDEQLLWVTAILLGFGLVMVYSASIAMPDSPRYARLDNTHFLLRHLLSIGVGVTAGVLAFATPMRQWQRLSPSLFILGLALLFTVLVIGQVTLGATRWIRLGPISLQPSELMKLFVVLYAADYTIRKQDYMQRFRKGFLPMGAAVVVVGCMLLLQRDLGAFVVICGIAMAVLFLGGISGRLFVWLIVAALSTIVMLIFAQPYRLARLELLLDDPFSPENAFGAGYQLTHALIAFGRGELFGVGLGGSIEKLNYLPEAHTDFLLAVIGEELGLVGVLVVIGLLFWLVRRGFEIGRQSIALDRPYSGLVAKGIAVWIAIQSLINVGVNTGVLPTKGLTLPLMSYGGSSILAVCLAVAILLRIDFENRQMMRGGTA
jgi:cell division protein FtsW